MPGLKELGGAWTLIPGFDTVAQLFRRVGLQDQFQRCWGCSGALLAISRLFAPKRPKSALAGASVEFAGWRSSVAAEGSGTRVTLLESCLEPVAISFLGLSRHAEHSF